MNAEENINSSKTVSASRGGGRSRRGKPKKGGFWKVFTVLIVILCGLALVAVVAFQLFQRKETITSTRTESTTTYAMVCETKTPKDPFFTVEGVAEAEHEIKVTYTGSMADKISYEYEAEMDSPEAVTKAEAKTHADYNIFMGNNTSDFSSNFMPMGTEYKINITTDVENLGSKTARIFFISEDDFNGLKDYNIEDLKRIIQTAGFHCETNGD